MTGALGDEESADIEDMCGKCEAALQSIRAEAELCVANMDSTEIAQPPSIERDSRKSDVGGFPV
jgi:hypothetical protein